MDYTSCCFPVTSVDLDLDLPDAPHDFYNHEDKELYELCELSSKLRKRERLTNLCTQSLTILKFSEALLLDFSLLERL